MPKKLVDGRYYIYVSGLPTSDIQKCRDIINELVDDGWMVRVTKGQYGHGKVAWKRRPKEGEKPKLVNVW
jgi:hypothetical protein